MFLGDIENAAFSSFETNYVLYVLNKESQALLPNEPRQANTTTVRIEPASIDKPYKDQKALHKPRIRVFFKQKDLDQEVEALFEKGVVSAQEL